MAVLPDQDGRLHVQAKLQYRKIDQFLLNFLMGEDSGITAPITTISEASGSVTIVPPGLDTDRPGANAGG